MQQMEGEADNGGRRRSIEGEDGGGMDTWRGRPAVTELI